MRPRMLRPSGEPDFLTRRAPSTGSSENSIRRIHRESERDAECWIAFLFVRVLCDCFIHRDDGLKLAENAALRHQLIVLRRKCTGRVRLGIRTVKKLIQRNFNSLLSTSLNLYCLNFPVATCYGSGVSLEKRQIQKTLHLKVCRKECFGVSGSHKTALHALLQ